MFLENSCCEPSRGDRKLPRRFNSVSAPWLCFLILSAEKSQCVYFQPSPSLLWSGPIWIVHLLPYDLHAWTVVQQPHLLINVSLSCAALGNVAFKD